MTIIPIKSNGVAAVLIKKIHDEAHVLLLKRAGSILTNTWCYIGGSIEEGESAIEAVLREIKEETNITNLTLYSSNQFDQVFSPHENYIYIAPVFVAFVNEEQEVELNDEHSEHKWLTFNDALKFISLPGNEDVLKSIERNFIHKKPADFLRI
ncbi:NUDIX hydrolase [Bacillus ndiopicus]|uniref:NUDIX hydrolase n=1 Tax=Bacillus ndiopicus TaxID=1347368 RepID=UPI0005AB115B|nr:NUDIX domain-containing protein [Bacillus ndiopicus]